MTGTEIGCVSRRDFAGFMPEWFANGSRFFPWDEPLPRPGGNEEAELEAARRAFLSALRRAAVAGQTVFRAAPALPEAALDGCTVVASREALLRLFPRDAVVAEIGTQYGYFARLILHVTAPRELHLVDLDLRGFPAADFAEPLERGQIILHETRSDAMLRSFPDGYFDWIYFDADHSYEGISRDVAAGYDKVKPGGLLAFDDYTLWSPYEMIAYGVPQAVHELIREKSLRIAYLTLDELGYPNVVLRKPG